MEEASLAEESSIAVEACPGGKVSLEVASSLAVEASPGEQASRPKNNSMACWPPPERAPVGAMVFPQGGC